MNKYEQLKEDLEKFGEGWMTCFGSSMLPILSNHTKNLYRKQDSYKIGDIVFCKVKGRYIDAHKITATKIEGGKTQYLISNNKGYDNGWTSIIYGKVIKAISKHDDVRIFE